MNWIDSMQYEKSFAFVRNKSDMLQWSRGLSVASASLQISAVHDPAPQLCDWTRISQASHELEDIAYWICTPEPPQGVCMRWLSEVQRFALSSPLKPQPSRLQGSFVLHPLIDFDDDAAVDSATTNESRMVLNPNQCEIENLVEIPKHGENGFFALLQRFHLSAFRNSLLNGI